jgi:hypothetical protein
MLTSRETKINIPLPLCLLYQAHHAQQPVYLDWQKPRHTLLKTIIDSKVNEGIYKLSDLQKKRIDSAREQIKKGQTISNESLQKEIDQWLNTK